MRTKAVIATISAVLASTILSGCGSDSTGTGTPTIPLVWTSIASGTSYPLYSVWGSSSSDVWAVGQGTVLHYSGTKWSTVATGTAPTLSDGSTQQTLLGVWGSSPSDVWVVGRDINLHAVIIHYAGSSWANVASPTPSVLNGIWGSSASDVWAVTFDGVIIHYDGTSWAISSSVVENTLYGVFGTSPSDVWAVGYKVIAHYDGTTWSKQTSTFNTLNAVWGTSPQDVWAVGVEGLLHNNGGIWSGSPTEVGAPDVPKAVWGSSSSNVWAVTSNFTTGGGGKIAHYDGESWTDATVGTLRNLGGIWGSSATDVWVVGDVGTVLHGVPPAL